MYISLSDLALFVLFALAVAVSAYLIAVLHRAYCVLGHVRGILAAHGDDIRATISLLPETLATYNGFAASLRETSEETRSIVRDFRDDLVVTADDLRDGLETFLVCAKAFGQVFKTVFSKAA